jgi:hypothetical protein
MSSLAAYYMFQSRRIVEWCLRRCSAQSSYSGNTTTCFTGLLRAESKTLSTQGREQMKSGTRRRKLFYTVVTLAAMYRHAGAVAIDPAERDIKTL